MSEAWRSAKVRSFEYVLAGSSDALLRVTARPSRRHARAGSLPRPMLLTDDGTSVNRYAPLPSPADERGLLRAAYSVHPRLLSDDTVFSLFLDGGFAIMLPKPEAGASRVAARDGEAAEGEDAETVAAVPLGAERRDDVSSKLTALSRELADARHEIGRLQSRVGRDDDELTRLRAGAAAVERERERAHQAAAAAEAQRAEAEAAQLTADERVRHAADETEQQLRAEWQARLDTANEQAERGAAELAAAEAKIATFDQRAEELQEAVRAADRQARQARQETAAAVTAQQDALATAEQHQTERLSATQARDVATRELVDMQETMHRLTVEHEEMTRQATAFDGVAQKARERAAEAESERETAGARLQELEVWSGELERRLTEATDELAGLKSGQEAGDSETRRLRGELAESEAKVELMQAHIQALMSQGGAAPAVEAGAPAEEPAPSEELLRAIRDAAVGEAREQAARDLARVAGELSA